MQSADNRRHFSRLPFFGQARLVTHEGEHNVLVEDISLKGVLVRFPGQNPLAAGEPCQLQLKLSSEQAMVMWARVVHVNGEQAGLHCEVIDLDSMTHLRRMVELNSGDPALLERELAQLTG